MINRFTPKKKRYFSQDELAGEYCDRVFCTDCMNREEGEIFIDYGCPASEAFLRKYSYLIKGLI